MSFFYENSHRLALRFLYSLGVVQELWEQAILPYNLPLTILLGLVGVFWVLSFLGSLDFDFLDFDCDADADGLGNALGAFMRFVNAREVPLTIILSLLVLFTWAGSILGNFYLNPTQSTLLAIGYSFASLVGSSFLVKAVTHPLRPFLRQLKDEEENQVPLVGASGTVKSRTLDGDFGQIEVPRTAGAPALLNAVMTGPHAPLSRGDEVLVVAFDAQRDKYLVRPLALLEDQPNSQF